jgi:hypothetical protein
MIEASKAMISNINSLINDFIPNRKLQSFDGSVVLIKHSTTFFKLFALRLGYKGHASLTK